MRRVRTCADDGSVDPDPRVDQTLQAMLCIPLRDRKEKRLRGEGNSPLNLEPEA